MYNTVKRIILHSLLGIVILIQFLTIPSGWKALIDGLIGLGFISTNTNTRFIMLCGIIVTFICILYPYYFMIGLRRLSDK